MGEVFIIGNANAGGGQLKKLQAASDLAAKHGVKLLVTNQLDEAHRILGDIFSREPELIALFGGDGSTHAIIDFCIRHGISTPPPILPLGGGSLRAIAHSLGWVRQKPESILGQVLALRREGQPLPIRVLSPLEITDGHNVNHGFVFANGVVQRIAYIFNVANKRTSLKLAMTIAGGIIRGLVAARSNIPAELAQFAGNVVMDDRELSMTRLLAVLASSIGPSLVPYPSVKPFVGECTDGQFHTLIFGGTAPEAARNIVSFVQGWRPAVATTENYLNEPTGKLTVTGEDEHYQVDGERRPMNGGVTITLSPHRFPFVRSF